MSWLVPTVTASTMIAQVCERHKVRCHIGLWKFGTRMSTSQSQNLLATGCTAAHLSKTAKGGASSVVIAPTKSGQSPELLRNAGR